MPSIRSWLFCVVLLIVVGPSAGLAAPLPDQAPHEVAPAPAWVRGESFRQDYRARDNYPAVVLLSDQQVRLGAQKESFQHFVLQALNAPGVQQASQLRISFNPAYHTLIVHGVKVHRSGTVRDVTSSTRFRLLQREERLNENIQDGYVTALAVLDDIRVGDIIEHSYSIVGSNPIFDDRYFGASDISGGLPIDRLRVRILSGADRPALNVRVINAAIVPRKSVVSGWKVFEVAQDDVPPVPFEDGTSPWYSPYAWVEFSEFRDWPDVADWAGTLYQLAGKDGRALAELHAKLKQQSVDTADYIIRALRFVQQEIRYEGLFFGENSHRPHPPDETLARRLGDCKDKTQLLLALLRREGIAAWPALVSTAYQRGITGSLPSPGLFDHVILAVDYGGKRHYLDSTRLYDGGGLDTLGRSHFDLALLVGAPEKELVTMYPDHPMVLSIEQFDDFYADDFESPVRYEVRTLYRGNEANRQRYLFSAEPLADIQRRYQAYYIGLFGEVEAGAPLQVVDDMENNLFEVRETWQLKTFWQTSEDGLLLAPVRIGTFSDLIAMPRQSVRKTPFRLPAYVQARNTTRIHYPMNLPLTFPAMPRVLDTPHFRYSYTDYSDNKLYTHIADLEVLADEVQGRDMAAYLANRKVALNQWEFTIRTPNPSSLGFDKIRRLRQSLEQVRKP